jgi:alpha-1,3-glucan synthase
VGVVPVSDMATLLLLVCALATLVQGLKWDDQFADYNLNQNREATNSLDYAGNRPKGWKGFASPTDWRIPTYTLFLDRFANGDPSNDNANETLFEQDITSNQLRHGGDLEGLIDSLDYIQGMGIKAIYIAGSPFINLPWGVDSYSVSH